MEVRRFKSEDLSQIKAWGKEYGYIYSDHQFPKVGYIVEGIAAYFLYQTDSTICFLEHLVANKKIEKTERSKAIDLIIKALLKHANDLGFRVAYACSDIPEVGVRAVMHGATVKPNHFLITKPLSDLSK